jgi:hypothetical protein
MKLLKWTAVTVAALLLAAVASTFFMSENFRVSHTHFIKASPEAVYQQIVVLKNWENWSYWKGLDDKMITTYNDIPAGVGASYSWKSDKKEVGNGSLTIERTIENEYVQSRLKFDGQGDGFSEYIIRKSEGGVDLVSAMNMKTEGVFQKLMARVLMKPMMTKAFKASSEKMDAYLQSNPDAANPKLDSVSARLIDSVSASGLAPKDCVTVVR